MFPHFLSLLIFSRVILLLIGKVLFIFFKLENDLSEIETSKTFIASFYLKILLIARIFPRRGSENTTQLTRYPRVLYVKPSKKMYVIHRPFESQLLGDGVYRS